MVDSDNCKSDCLTIVRYQFQLLSTTYIYDDRRTESNISTFSYVYKLPCDLIVNVFLLSVLSIYLKIYHEISDFTS